MANAPSNESFNLFATQDMLMVIWSTHSWPEHLNVINLTLCHPELVKSYFINLFMTNAP